MNRDYVSGYVSRQLKKCSGESQDDSPNEAEMMLLSCGYQELLRKVLLTAREYAQQDGSREVMGHHIESALESIF